MDKEQNLLISQIIKAGKYFHAQGWLPATSGNLSMRLDQQNIVITESGNNKGELVEDNFLVVDMAACPQGSNKKPSAETLLHTQLYQWNSKINAVFHVHSINSVVISKLFRKEDELVLENYELLKAFAGNRTHATKEVVPIFSNTQNIAELSMQIENYLEDKPFIHGYLIEGHGLYSWGESSEEALRHVEAFENLFDMEIRYRSHKSLLS